MEPRRISTHITKRRLLFAKKSPVEVLVSPAYTKRSDLPAFFPKHYATPSTKDMAIILTYFNPSFSMRIMQNILMVKHYLESAGLPLYIGEVAFDEAPFLFEEASNIIQIRSTSYMNYKANLVNTVEMEIPSRFTKICVLDAEIMFDNPNWYTTVAETLDTYDLCQPFNRTCFLGLDFRPIKWMTNAVDRTESTFDWEKEHMGHAWAFDRKWYKETNISDLTVMGGDDLLLLYMIRNVDIHENATIQLYKELSKKINPTITSCDLTIYHLYHGSFQNRQYGSCMVGFAELMKKLNKSSIHDLVTRRSNNILKWNADVKQQCNVFMQNYFYKRHDDGTSHEPLISPKFFTVPYMEPNTKDMAMILVFFNPNPYVRIMQNILTVKHGFDAANIPYYIAELAFENNQFLFKPGPNVFHFRSNSYMFYKENLISVIEPNIPSTYTKLCIMDADILMTVPNWYSITSNTLNRVDVCQPFKRCYWLNLEYKVLKERKNCVDSKSKEVNWMVDHPGFIWAFNRSWKGLKPYLSINIPTIGGDSLLMFLIRGYMSNVNTVYTLNDIPKPTVDSAAIDAYHLNHGAIIKRQYYNVIAETKKLLDKFKKSSMDDLIYTRPDGILEWKQEYMSEMNTFMKLYFKTRCEDDDDDDE